MNRQSGSILEENEKKKEQGDADSAGGHHSGEKDVPVSSRGQPDHDLNQSEIDLSTESSSMQVEMTQSHKPKEAKPVTSENDVTEGDPAEEEDRISVIKPDEMAYQTEAYSVLTEHTRSPRKEQCEKKRTSRVRIKSKKSHLNDVVQNKPDRSKVTCRKGEHMLPQTISQPVSMGKGVAYLSGNTIRLTGGVKLMPGDEIRISDKEFVLRSKQRKHTAQYAAGVLVLLIGFLLLTPLLNSHNYGNLVGVVLDESTRYSIPNARVYLKETGKSMQTNALGFFIFKDLSPGLYSIETSHTGYRTRRENVTITKDQSTTLGIRLAPLSGGASSGSGSAKPTDPGGRETTPSGVTTNATDHGSIRIRSNVSEPTILVDNKTVGRGNKLYQKIAPGAHQIVVSKEGYYDWVGEAKVKSGETLNLQVQLSEDRGTQLTTPTWSDYLNSGNQQKDSGDLTQALSSFDQALSLNPYAPEVLQGRGSTHLLTGDKAKAAEDLDRAGKLFLDRQDYQNAIHCFNDLLILNDKDPSYSFHRGICFLKMGQYRNSIPDLKRAVELDRGLFAGYVNLGEAYIKAGNYKLSIEAYKHARKLNQRSPEVWVGLTKTYYAKGDKSEARKSYRRYEELSTYLDREKMKQDRGWIEILKDIEVEP